MTDSTEVQSLLAQLAGAIARRHALETPREAAPRAYDAAMTYRFVSTITCEDRSRRALMKFAGWLWNTGTHDMASVLAIVEDRVRRDPKAPYQYYAPGGPAREAKEARLAIDFAARENAAFKQADARFFQQEPREKE